MIFKSAWQFTKFNKGAPTLRAISFTLSFNPMRTINFNAEYNNTRQDTRLGAFHKNSGLPGVWMRVLVLPWQMSMHFPPSSKDNVLRFSAKVYVSGSGLTAQLQRRHVHSYMPVLKSLRVLLLV